jgi:hypothetical protein
MLMNVSEDNDGNLFLENENNFLVLILDEFSLELSISFAEKQDGERYYKLDISNFSIFVIHRAHLNEC